MSLSSGFSGTLIVCMLDFLMLFHRLLNSVLIFNPFGLCASVRIISIELSSEFTDNICLC